MSQKLINQKLSEDFAYLFKDFSTSNYRQTYQKLSNFLETLLAEDQFVANNNHLIGLNNLQNSLNVTKRPLPPLLRQVTNTSSSSQTQTILITHCYLTHTSPSLQQTSYQQGLKIAHDFSPPQLIVYYHNKFYLVRDFLTQSKNKSLMVETEREIGFELEKNLVLSSEEIQVDRYSRIIIQPHHYPPQRFPKSAFSSIATLRPYSPFFHPKNDLLTIQNLNYTATNTLRESLSLDYTRILKQNHEVVSKDHNERQNKLYQFHCMLKSKLECLSQVWHVQEAQYRVGLVYEQVAGGKRVEEEEKCSTVFVYNRFQLFEAQKKSKTFKISLSKDSALTQTGTSFPVEENIRAIKQLLLMSMIYRRTRPVITQILSTKQKISTSLYWDMKEKQASIEQNRKQRIERIRNSQSLSNFSAISIESFFKQWKGKIAEAKGSKTAVLAMDLSDMFLTTEYKYVGMRCEVYVSYQKRHKHHPSSSQLPNTQFLKKPILTSTTSRNPNSPSNVSASRSNQAQSLEPIETIQQSQRPRHIHSQIYTFVFDQDIDDWNVKLSPEEENEGQRMGISSSGRRDNQSLGKNKKRSICFDLSEVKDLFKIRVRITPTASSTNNRPNTNNPLPLNSRIQGYCQLSKITKLRMNGQNQELVLYETSGQEKTVGFLGFFYLLKEYLDPSQAEMFKIRNYRRIKFLENVGQIPANYFQPTPINYTPNSLFLFSQLLSTNKSTITNRNFESNYVTLIEFLQAEKMDRRRTQIIEKENENITKSQLSLMAEKNQAKCLECYERVREYQRVLKGEFTRGKFVGSRVGSNSPLVRENQDRKDVINTFVYYQIPSSSDQISHKTFGLLSQSLKASMHKSQKLFCSDAHIQTLGIMSMIFSLNESNVKQTLVSVYRAIDNQSEPRVELTPTSTNIGHLQTFNPFLVPLTNRLITLFKLHRPSQLSDRTSFRSQSSLSSSLQPELQTINPNHATEFTINFLSQLYPYFHTKNLQRECLYVRYFVQKHLPQVNFMLNRKNVGLENFVVKCLLSLFSVGVEEEITFQIWDFLVGCANKFAGRVNCVLTLLIFLEKTDFQPVIPVSSFAIALNENYKRFDFSNTAKKIADQMVDTLGQIYIKEHQRKQALYQLRDEKEKLLIGGDFFKRVMFDSQRQNRVNFIGNKKVNLNSLPYKLPEPKYYGYPIESIKLLIKSIFITDTVSLTSWSLTLRWHNMSSSRIPINHKNQILNQFLSFEYPQQTKDNSFNLPHIEFMICPDNERENEEGRMFVGYLPVVSLHKDCVVCEEVRLVYVVGGQVRLTNKGENGVVVQVVVKSKEIKDTQRYLDQDSNSLKKSNLLESSKKSVLSATVNNINLRLQKEYQVNEQKRLDLLYDRLLDYDLNQDHNDAVKEMKKLKVLFQKMKNPIDQFSKDKYEKLKVPSVGDMTFPEVVMNSELLIEHLQALVDETFPDSKQLKAHLPEIYKIFSKNTNFQMVFLTEILIEAVLLDKTVSFEQKIEYLYCLGKHYQNTSGTGLTTQTVDFIFQYIFKTYGWLTGVPYSPYGKGEIQHGVIYTSGLKVKEEGLDITNILKDWAHICKLKYGHLGLFLGDAEYLTGLRALLPLETLERLEKTNRAELLRVEVGYKKHGGGRYVWSATVDVRDFRVKEVGTKFLQHYPTHSPLHAGLITQHISDCRNPFTPLSLLPRPCRHCPSPSPIELDTSSEILYNCSNFISLESSSTISRQAFRDLFYTTPLVSYLLQYSSVYEPVKEEQGRGLVVGGGRAKEGQNQAQQMEEFKDWVLYRYQNGIQEWRQCQILSTQGEMRYVKLPPSTQKVQTQITTQLSTRYNMPKDPPLLIKAPIFEVWSMDENFVDQYEETEEPGGGLREERERKKRKTVFGGQRGGRRG